jgi:hypothetical protein
MRHLAVLAVIAALVAGMSGCAAARSGGDFRRSLGNATAPDAMDSARRIMAMHQFEVEREEQTPQSILVQSRWRKRDPFTDEALLGVSETETRITLSGRWRLQTQQGPLYGVDVLVERRVIMLNREGWVDSPRTPEYVAFADAIANGLQRDINNLVRRF